MTPAQAGQWAVNLRGVAGDKSTPSPQTAAVRADSRDAD
jgi:hypothetical protein